MILRKRWFLTLVLLAAIVTGAYATRGVWLPQLGHFLVADEEPAPAEIIVVLAGGALGDRILRAGELLRRGYAPRVLVNGANTYYGRHETDLAREFAAENDVPREALEPFPIDADSTMQEAELVDRELSRRGVRKALVVTSNFHTRRSKYLFAKHGSGRVAYTFVAASHPEFDPQNWWRTREGKKTFLLESMKIVYSWIE